MADFKVKFLGFPHSDSYRSLGHKPWKKGEVRVLSEGLKDKLISTFPGAFQAEESLKVEAQEKK